MSAINYPKAPSLGTEIGFSHHETYDSGKVDRWTGSPLTSPVTDLTVHLASQSNRFGAHDIDKPVPRRWSTRAASQHTQI